MLGPTDLPQELLDKIIGDAADSSLDVKSLCNYSLVGRRWYLTGAIQIYSKWTYNGEEQSFVSFWRFLRTDMNSTRIAGLVQTLDIWNWEYQPQDITPVDHHTDLSHDDMDHTCSAIYSAGIEELMDDIIYGLSVADRTPLMALLLTHLPNVTTINAHVPESDFSLTEVLKHALKVKMIGLNCRHCKT
jgi:hypothetical protein